MYHELYWGLVPLQKKEYNELLEKAKKLEAIKKWLLTMPDSYNKRGPITKNNFLVWKTKGFNILKVEKHARS